MVETPRGIWKIFTVHFNRDGSVFLLFPYFSRTDGFVSVVSRQPGDGRLDYLTDGAFTSHQVKFSHHPDGRAHFSQTGKVRTAIGKQSIRLDELHGPAFLVRCQGLDGFAPLSKSDRTKKAGQRVVVGAQFDHHVQAVNLMGHWHTKQDLLQRTPERVLGPMIRVRRPNGEFQNGTLIGPPPYRPPRDHVVFLTCEEASVTPEQDSFLLLLGGFDAPFNFHERSAAFSFLLLAYPRGALAAVPNFLQSIDL